MRAIKAKELLENIEYRRNLEHNYLLIQARLQPEEDYAVKMFQENRIPYLLKMDRLLENGERKLRYDISSLQSLKRIYQQKKITGSELMNILTNIWQVYEVVPEYMLDENRVYLFPEYIFCNLDIKDFHFLYYPGGDAGLSFYDQFIEISEFFMDHMDHEDHTAVVLGYQFHRIIKNENFVLEDIKRLCEQIRFGKEQSTRNENVSSGAQFHSKDEFNYESRFSEEKTGNYRNEFFIEENGNRNNGYLEENNNNQNYGASPANKKNTIADFLENKKMKQLLPPVIFMVLALIGFYYTFLGKEEISSNRQPIAIGILAMGIGGLVYWFYGRKKISSKAGANAETNTKIVEPNNRIVEPNKRIVEVNKKSVEPNKRIVEANKKSVEEEAFEQSRSMGQPYYGYFEETISAENQPPFEQKMETEQTTFYVSEGTGEQRILVQMDRGKEISHPINQLPFTIGKREDMVNLVVKDTTISRLHAQIFQSEGYLYLTDLGSTNGTFLNGIPIPQEDKLQLEVGDEIRLGSVEFVYR